MTLAELGGICAIAILVMFFLAVPLFLTCVALIMVVEVSRVIYRSLRGAGREE